MEERKREEKERNMTNGVKPVRAKKCSSSVREREREREREKEREREREFIVSLDKCWLLGKAHASALCWQCFFGRYLAVKVRERELQQFQIIRSLTRV